MMRLRSSVAFARRAQLLSVPLRPPAVVFPLPAAAVRLHSALPTTWNRPTAIGRQQSDSNSTLYRTYDYFFGKSFSMSPGFRAATPSGFFRRFTSRPGSARPRLS